MSRNDITGDRLITKPNSKSYLENHEKIFGKKNISQGKEEAVKNAEEIKVFKANQQKHLDGSELSKDEKKKLITI